jgi:hypothetical protein
VSMWIRKEIQALLWKNYTSLKWRQSHCGVTLPENADTSVDRIKAFLRTQLPLSAEMAINRQTFGGEMSVQSRSLTAVRLHRSNFDVVLRKLIPKM